MSDSNKEKAFFNNSEEISQISIAEGSIDESKEGGPQSPSQSLLTGREDENVGAEHSEELFPPSPKQSMSSKKSVGEKMDAGAEHSEDLFPSSSSESVSSKNMEKMDVVAEHSEDMFPPSSSISLLQEIDDQSLEPVVSQKSNVISVVDKLLKEAEAQSNSKKDDLATDDTNEEDSMKEPDSEAIDDDIGDDEVEDSEDVENIKDSEAVENIEDLSEDEVDEESAKQIAEDDTNVVEMEEVQEEIEDVPSEDDDDTMSFTPQLPFSKVKKIIKADGENNQLVNKEAVFLASIAAELFIANLTQQTARITHSTKKKTMTLVHLKSALAGNETYDFLEGCYPEIY